MDSLKNQIPPYGGELCNLVLSQEAAENLKSEAANFHSVSLSQRQVCDLEMLMNGAYSPLKGFMNEDEYNSVVEGCRLPNGLLWPMPVIFDVPQDFIDKNDITRSSKIALQDGEGLCL